MSEDNPKRAPLTVRSVQLSKEIAAAAKRASKSRDAVVRSAHIASMAHLLYELQQHEERVELGTNTFRDVERSFWTCRVAKEGVDLEEFRRKGSNPDAPGYRPSPPPNPPSPPDVE